MMEIFKNFGIKISFRSSVIIQKGASDKIAGATLEEYRSKINADAGDVGDEIAKALEELESAQTALDNTKQESVSQK